MPSREPNLVGAMPKEPVMVQPEDTDIAKEASLQENKVTITTNQLVKVASAITVAHHIHQGSVLHMDRIASTVAKVAIT